jgi:ER membrane protein complex subunit 7
VDPELKAEFEERQKAQPNPAANPLQNFDAAAWLAGSTPSTSKRTEVPSNADRGITR